MTEMFIGCTMLVAAGLFLAASQDVPAAAAIVLGVYLLWERKR